MPQCFGNMNVKQTDTRGNNNLQECTMSSRYYLYINKIIVCQFQRTFILTHLLKWQNVTEPNVYLYYV